MPDKPTPNSSTSPQHAMRARALRRLIELLAERVARRLLEDAAAAKARTTASKQITD